VIAQAALVGRLPAASAAARAGRDRRWATSTALRRSLAAAHHRAHRQAVGAALRGAGLGALIDDPRFRDRARAPQPICRARRHSERSLRQEAYEHWRQALAAKEVTFGVISRPQDVPDDDQAVACGAIVETAILTCRARSAIPSASASPSSASPSRRRARRTQRGDPARGRTQRRGSGLLKSSGAVR
jgi:crotonobetainyl-CoA:carnitine CoA-transferase CaiB-like acyl-CoA transferase